MNLSEIKSKLQIETLSLNTAMDKDNNPTEWMRHWDDENRIAISVHKELVSELQADPEINTLGLQTETRQGSKGPYTAIRIVKFTPAEVIL